MKIIHLPSPSNNIKCVSMYLVFNTYLLVITTTSHCRGLVGLEVIGFAYCFVCSRFIVDEVRNPSYKMLRSKIEN